MRKITPWSRLPEGPAEKIRRGTNWFPPPFSPPAARYIAGFFPYYRSQRPPPCHFPVAEIRFGVQGSSVRTSNYGPRDRRGRYRTLKRKPSPGYPQKRGPLAAK